MDDKKRLGLIIEAINYCKRVRSMDMPASCYTKALREPIFFLWECRTDKRKHHAAKFRSKNAVGLSLSDGNLVYDHAIPFNLTQKELLALPEVTQESVQKVLLKHVAAVITQEEHGQLGKSGYASKMPDDWDHIDPLARYKAVGIEIVENIPA